MKLLALETATEACSVAVLVDGELRERFDIAPRRHAELALPWAEALLADAGVAKSQLDAIAVGRGPGAFTGVRLAIALAQGIALALDRPLVPVSTLAVLASQVPPPPVIAGEGGCDIGVPHRILAAIDAKIAGQQVVAATPQAAPDSGQVIDLMEALRASLQKKPATPKAKPAATVTSIAAEPAAKERKGAKRAPAAEVAAPAKARARK